MRIALTGSDGMLGSDITKVFTDVELITLTLRDFDITDLDKTKKNIKEIKPEYLIHAAAYTDVDGSENNPDKAFLVNGIGTRNVAIACQDINCPIVYISTDYVFDGKKKDPYNEWDISNPINKYGLSKLIGENFVTSLTNRFYIVRTSWLYGKNGKNFVDTILRLMSERKEVEVVDDQKGSPTYTYDLAVTLRELIGKGFGIYHISNTSQCSWYEFALEIAKLKGMNTNIKPITSNKFKRPAKRPFFSVLNNTMLRLEGIKGLRHWKEALKEYLEQST
ncbi:MAG: dTDP-4-dehydrorhamnose reductase [Thermodesulfovibrionia bacterium]|nr:dTDP-4-dehydrorhamnose reductase [Thermodesulfovibrionia bacterium]